MEGGVAALGGCGGERRVAEQSQRAEDVGAREGAAAVAAARGEQVVGVGMGIVTDSADEWFAEQVGGRVRSVGSVGSIGSVGSVPNLGTRARAPAPAPRLAQRRLNPTPPLFVRRLQAARHDATRPPEGKPSGVGAASTFLVTRDVR